MIKAILQALNIPDRTPLDEHSSARVAVHLQIFRYMMALYAGMTDQNCPASFGNYLRTAVRTSGDVYSWTKDDKQYYKKMSFRTLQFEHLRHVFQEVQKHLSAHPKAV